jgi:hypothetical protein
MKPKFSILLVLLQVIINTFSKDISIDEGRYVEIGGIEQWITIKGENTGNPMILFIHGVPGHGSRFSILVGGQAGNPKAQQFHNANRCGQPKEAFLV